MAGYLIGYIISFILAGREHYYLSGTVLILTAIWQYIRDYSNTKNLIHLRGLFSLFWIGGQGLSCLKLSWLQREWAWMTWLCFVLAYVGFWIVFETLCRMYGAGYEIGRASCRERV